MTENLSTRVLDKATGPSWGRAEQEYKPSHQGLQELVKPSVQIRMGSATSLESVCNPRL